MCIIIAKQPNGIVTEDTLHHCWNANDDGAGFMYAKHNQLHIEKGFMEWDNFIERYRSVISEHGQQLPMVIHFRIATHGKINEENTHPFTISNKMAFAHNGMIKCVETTPEHSDTWHFNEAIIKPMQKLDNKFLKKQHNIKLLSEVIGYSKLVFLQANGEITIINKNLGDDKTPGIWYSNSSYKPKVIQPPQQQQQRQTIPYYRQPKDEYWWLEKGEYARIKKPIYSFKTNELVFVQDLVGLGAIVVKHDFDSNHHKVVEKTALINREFLKEVDYTLGDSWYV